MPEVVGVQFIKGGLVHYFWPPKNQPSLHLNDYCVVETEHGQHIAKVVHPMKQIAKEHLAEKIKSILREANQRDFEMVKGNEQKERDAYKLCRQKVVEKKLAMKLVDVSYSLDARKAVFYFTAENRVDFRELVKDLAHVLKVKIEMRQIGVRDEARRLGGVGCCGRALCCCTFLKDFVSVSIRMAKEQNLSLNPTKVSGLCGRLMCCLSYEYEGRSKGKKTGSHDKKSGDEKNQGSRNERPGKLDGKQEGQECSSACHQECPGKEVKQDIVEESEMIKSVHPDGIKAVEEQIEKSEKQDQTKSQHPRQQPQRKQQPSRQHHRQQQAQRQQQSQQPKSAEKKQGESGGSMDKEKQGDQKNKNKKHRYNKNRRFKNKKHSNRSSQGDQSSSSGK